MILDIYIYIYKHLKVYIYIYIYIYDELLVVQCLSSLEMDMVPQIQILERTVCILHNANWESYIHPNILPPPMSK